MTRILILEGEEPEVSGLLYKAVVHAVLPFGGRYVGPEPTHIVDPDKLPAQGCATAHQEASEAGGGGGMGLSSTGGSDGGRGFRGDHGIYH